MRSLSPQSHPTGPPNTANQEVLISGSNFKTGIMVNLTNGTLSIPGTTGTGNSTMVRCTFALAGAPPRLYNLTLLNIDGATETLTNAFTITNASPTITSITPATGYNSSSIPVTIDGTAFRNGATVTLVNTVHINPGSYHEPDNNQDPLHVATLKCDHLASSISPLIISMVHQLPNSTHSPLREP